MDARVIRLISILSIWLSVCVLPLSGQDYTAARQDATASTASELVSEASFYEPPRARDAPPLDGDDPQATGQLSATEIQATKVIARVGDEVILAGDLYGQVNQFLQERLKEIPPEQRDQVTPELVRERRWQLIQKMLPQAIDGKLVYLDFLRSIPAERVPEIQDSLYKAFDEQQLPLLIERTNVQTAADLDRLLRSFGSSLAQQRLTFAEQLAAVQWKQRNASSRKEVSHEDIITYYRTNLDQYRIEAKAKWEQLAALDSQTSSREASRQLVAEMGNEVFRGASFAAVAKRKSHGPTAAIGGQYEWTTKGSLRSEILDRAIFSLPIGYLSQILEDEDGCHIVRVIERQDETFIPFAEAQGTIRKKIQEDRSEAALREYVEGLREDFRVWTIFDDNPNYVGT